MKTPPAALQEFATASQRNKIRFSIQPRSAACLTITFVLAITFHAASPVTAESFLDPVKVDTPQAEIQGYGLPYGGLGFVSHLLTYFTVVCLGLTQDPLMPWKKIRHPWRSFCLGLVSLILSVGFAIFTIVRGASTWQFVTIAVWKVVLSTFLGFSAMSAALSARPRRASEAGRIRVTQSDAADNINLLPLNGPEEIRRDGPEQRDLHENDSPGWWLLYAVGLVVGLAGLFSLTKENWENHTIRLITYIMWGVLAAAMGIVAMVFAMCRP
jgi:hypothetical protein